MYFQYFKLPHEKTLWKPAFFTESDKIVRNLFVCLSSVGWIVGLNRKSFNQLQFIQKATASIVKPTIFQHHLRK